MMPTSRLPRPPRRKEAEAVRERARIITMLRHRAGTLSAEADKLHAEHAYDFEWRKREEASTVREVIRWIEAI